MGRICMFFHCVPNSALIHIFERKYKRFCPFLLERVKDLGVDFVINANLTSIHSDNAEQSFSIIQIKRPCSSSFIVPCKAIVLAANPQSDQLFSRTFPEAKIKLPLKATNTAGNHHHFNIPG